MTQAKTLIVMAILFLGAGQMFGQCTDLFFSEYLEGSSSNKALEIYNPSASTVDLTGVQIHRLNGGSTTTDTFKLAGMLAAYDVYVVANSLADPAILAVADTTGSATFYNGDDALVLINVLTGDTLDVFGTPGIDPGTNWPVGTGASAEFTLVRMTSVSGGSTNWATGAMEWDVFPQNTFTELGAHTSNCATVASTGCSKLFFSEYLEGSASNKALEIYNPSTMPIDLSNIQIHRQNGGSTTIDTFRLAGVLAPYDVYVVANASADPAILAVADTTGSATFYNGDDALVLLDAATGDTLDVFGTPGIDPGSNWPVGSGASAEFTLVRMVTVDGGSTNWATGATEWEVFPQNTFTELGAHISACELLASGCDKIFFSEYIEGSGNNKALEIYNPTAMTVDLSDIQIHRQNGGSTTIDTFRLAGSIAPYDVYVVANASADAAILAQADTTGSATFYNGDDALVLINGATGDTLDVFGTPGVDPGTNWPVGTGFSSEFTLVRMFSITAGSTDWATGAMEWDVFPQNTFSELGSHSNVCAPPATDTEVSFAVTNVTVSEGAGTATFDISLINATNDTVAVNVTLSAASTATAGVDFTFMDTTVVFAANSTGPISLSAAIIEDLDVESDETIVLVLSMPTNGAVLTADSVLTITISDNDYPVYSIGLVTADSDGDGAADSVGVKCELHGLVYGVNLSTSALQFGLRDTTDGIQVFSFSGTFGYTVVEGDSIIVQGTIDQFNGLAEIIPDNVELVSSGNTISEPVVVTSFDETTENEYIQLNCVTLVDASLWPLDGANANVEFTNGVDTFTVRIDKETDVDGTPAPVGFINIKGIGSQFDGTSPYNDGYQLFPMFPSDLMALPAETAALSIAADAIDESAGTYTFKVYLGNANPDMTSFTLEVDAASTATENTDFSVAFSYDFSGCGDSDTVDVVVTVTDDTDVEGDETVVLNLVSSDPATSISNGTLTLTITETDNIRDLLPAGVVKAYPNPGRDMIRLESSIMMEKASLINLNGQTVRELRTLSQDLNINTAELPAGIYLLQVETVNGLWMQRWVKN
ncbi:MAG: lamin tail domain-containing protein [Bacteroidia bacterium]|nr:lamin tail domain-containing protein [Bacteroidia bacterium]